MLANRFNIYTCIHKGLRAAMGDVLVELGRVDDTDESELLEVLNKTETLLHFCTAHLKHENEFIHPKILAVYSDQKLQTVDDHVGHEQSIVQLLSEVNAIRALNADDKATALLTLYRHFALFVAENYEHMHTEETVNASLLWQHYSDEQIIGIEQTLIASLKPEIAAASLMMMLPNLNVRERNIILCGLQQAMPAEAYTGLLAGLTPKLTASAIAKLPTYAVVETHAVA